MGKGTDSSAHLQRKLPVPEGYGYFSILVVFQVQQSFPTTVPIGPKPCSQRWQGLDPGRQTGGGPAAEGIVLRCRFKGGLLRVRIRLFTRYTRMRTGLLAQRCGSLENRILASRSKSASVCDTGLRCFLPLLPCPVVVLLVLFWMPAVGLLVT